MNCTLLSSPLQGFTDFRFRNTFQKYFGGIDTYYAPYIRLHGKHEIKSSYERDILPKNNSLLNLIPQVMTKDADEFLFVADYVKELGYKELNWNLGCPYPMVAKKGLGSGLLKDYNKIDEILKRVFNESDIQVSVKMRLGYEDQEEILKVLPILEKYKLKNIVIHPRLGKQLYKGKVDLDAFEKCLDFTTHELHYNGDISSVSVFNDMKDRFPMLSHWMLGRGILMDPFLPQMIKENNHHYPENRYEIFSKFHDSLFHEYQQALSGSSHLLIKMIHFWEYFSFSFSNPRKTYKKIKKSKNIKAYEVAVKEILNSSF